MNKKEWHDIWLKERDEAIRTQDIEKFKELYNKWKARGVYQLDMPSDKVIEISLRKSLYHLGNATDEEKAYAKKWLNDRGYSTDV